MAATDGGGFPRNNLIGKLLSLYRLGYISLTDIIRKASLHPAQVFGIKNKGHIGVGADADITILNEEMTSASESYVNGKQIMKSQIVTGSGANLICTEAGRAAAKKNGLSCIIADLENSAFYKGF
jgi:imidazolonepropionase-like amidohydrolase